VINKIGLCDQARSRRPCAIVTPYNARVNGQNSPRTTPSRTKPLSFRTKRSLKRRELGFGLELCPGGGFCPPLISYVPRSDIDKKRDYSDTSRHLFTSTT